VRAGAARSSTVVAVGGGSTLDAAGFTASLFMRGVSVVHVPTTLLAALDAAHGGKTAADVGRLKNLVGTFWQPLGVYVPLDLVAHEVEQCGGRGGAAEYLKTCLLRGTEEHEILACVDDEGRLDVSHLPQVIGRAVRFKMGLVEQDERDTTGVRRQLNLGHTLAHLLESHSGFQVDHGTAVGCGLVVAARMSEQRGIAIRGLAAQVERLCRRLGLWPPPPEVKLSSELVEGLLSDKKRVGDRVNLVLLKQPGKPTTVSCSLAEAKNLMGSCLGPIIRE